ncbi:D-alanine--D-alanine ligase [Thermoflavimicrobium dichotomicum]|uniref:D-alanine--D-alanine ligase n=1 Tax=Thermoflavimicrobium dichotomicum TaxID=46223 RepID=A0A1I3R8I0_9BACL|nr:D-alanine--D-alanine ligase [Thermoflavimicrobium dichotomicum]SFJ42648.1 D-alanine-D-alanine ligase [Thermoflavimicrobium dichotomicum]
MDRKIRVAVLFGGKSGEHEVSLSSAASVIRSMDPNKYEVLPIGITKEGEWKIGDSSLPLLASYLAEEKLAEIQNQLPAVTISADEKQTLPSFRAGEIDVVFPVLHGTYGEDGTMQGLLEIANVPYVGSGVLASAVGMDKVISKKIFEQAGLPQCKYVYYLRTQYEANYEYVIRQIENELGYPCFVKPANLGSSVGISKAMNQQELVAALNTAFRYDRKVIVEEYVPAREVEVAVLGNDFPEASVPGEIISSNDFYDYKAKYIDGKSVMQIPADLPEDVALQIRAMAIKAYQSIDCAGLARVDFFVRKDNEDILINEINTMPGFTPYSMYAKLWEYSGIDYSELVSRLIDLAIDRYDEKSRLLTKFEVE